MGAGNGVLDITQRRLSWSFVRYSWCRRGLLVLQLAEGKRAGGLFPLVRYWEELGMRRSFSVRFGSEDTAERHPAKTSYWQPISR